MLHHPPSVYVPQVQDSFSDSSPPAHPLGENIIRFLAFLLPQRVPCVHLFSPGRSLSLPLVGQSGDGEVQTEGWVYIPSAKWDQGPTQPGFCIFFSTSFQGVADKTTDMLPGSSRQYTPPSGGD